MPPPERTEPAVPPLPEEDHECLDCALRYDVLSTAGALGLIEQLPEQVRAFVRTVHPDRLSRRPAPATWSALEYLCHLRDVLVTSTIRLHRVRTEDRPVLEPMLNDLRARRFRYNEHDPGAVLDELTWAARGLLDEAARVHGDGWERVATRLPGEERTARWLVRHAAHEGRHHLADIADIAADLRSGTDRTPRQDRGMTALHIYLGYHDAPTAIDWLERAFGFRTIVRYPDDAGGIAHSELRCGEAAIVVFSDRDGYERPPRKGPTTGSGAYLSVLDEAVVDQTYARALDGGATGVWAPHMSEWGNYRCRVVDPEGYEWTFGTYRPGESPDPSSA